MPTVNPKIFKSYDIRGIYPTELNEDTAYIIGQAYAQLTKAKAVIVGRDMRIGSPELAKKIIEGLIDQGVIVHDTSLVPIDAIYFAVGKKYDGGIYITASHNPKEYNGLKMPVRGAKGLGWIRGTELFEFMQDKKFKTAKKPGTVTKRDIMPEYIKHILSFVDIKRMKPFKVVIDAGNGLAGKVAPLLFAKLPCELIPLNFEMDGTFPAHPSNPLLPESQVQICKKVVEEKADFGMIMDGDTDRLFFITEKGDFIRADTTLLILAKYFLEHNPGIGVAYNVICSKAVPQRITEWGGKPLRSAVGYVNVATAMREGSGIMGGEVSAHYSFRDNYYADSGFIALVILLMLISEHNKKLSEIIEGLNPYVRADETNITVKNIPAIIAAVKEKYKDAIQDELDGLTIEYKDWWVNVRPSNTEPLLRITVEGDTEAIMKQRHTEVVEFIKSIA